MDIILLEKTHDGNIGDIVRVKRGYARNFLIPQGKAVQATPEKIEQFELRRAELEKAAAELLLRAQQRAEKATDLIITIASKASSEGKLFGSVGVREVVAAMLDVGLAVEHKEVDLVGGPIRSVGEYIVHVQFHNDICVPVQVIVTAAETAAS